MQAALERQLAEKVEEILEAYGELTCKVGAADLLEVGQLLRDGEEFRFKFLADITGIDCGGGAFEVVYHLLSMEHKRRLRLKIKVAEGEKVSSVTGIWPTANWHERECYDLLGIEFAGHPDLSRILMPEGFSGHPLRKDYPVKGE
jgi:NADH-quinone oxidoreductase subunit C